MKLYDGYCLVFCIMSSFLGFSQGNDQEQAVQQTVDTFFEAFHKGDTTLLRSVLHKDVIFQTIYKNKQGVDILRHDDVAKWVQAIANKPEGQKWTEKLLDYSIKIDANMANAWIPYEFYLNDEFSHCGVNSFQMINDVGRWKVIYLVDTRRRATCRE